MSKTLLKPLVLLALLFTGFPSQAWDGAVAGTIANYHVIVGSVGGAPGNFDLRVTLVGAPILCTGGTTWAYVNSNEANYQATVAAVMAAKATGNALTIYSNRDANNYCRIGYLVVS